MSTYYETEVTIHAAPTDFDALRVWGVDAVIRLHAAMRAGPSGPGSTMKQDWPHGS